MWTPWRVTFVSFSTLFICCASFPAAATDQNFVVWRNTFEVAPSVKAVEYNSVLQGFVSDGAGGQFLFGMYAEKTSEEVIGSDDMPPSFHWTYYPWVVRTDAQGRELWSKTYPVTPYPSIDYSK